MKSAVVTGCLGFIGFQLARRLLADKWDVVGIDYFTLAGVDSEYRLGCLNSIGEGRFRYIDCDLSKRLCDTNECGVFFHLAAIPGIGASVENPAKSYSNNVASTVNALSLAVGSHTRRFVFASSSSVYGNGASNGLTCHEDSTPLQPLNAYAASKAECERIVADFASYAGLEAAILRPFSVYGPGMRPDLAMSLIADSIQTGSPFRMRGSGSSERDYTYIDDVVDAFIRAAEVPVMSAGGKPYQTFNVCGGRTVSLSEVVASLESAFGRKANIVRVEESAFDAVRTSGCNDKAREMLSWAPTVGFEEGVLRFATWRQSRSIKLRLN